MTNRLLLICICFFSLFFLSSKCKKDETASLAAFTYSHTCGGNVPCLITFSNQSSGFRQFQWDFGDGDHSNEVNPRHTYYSLGTYTVTLKATGIDGEQTTFQTVNLYNTPPCESRGSISCAKKLLSGISIIDTLTKINNYYVAYYYFKPTRPGVGMIRLSPIPGSNPYQRATLDILDAPNNNANVIATATGYSGETVNFYCGPILANEYYLRVQHSGTPNPHQNFNLLYEFIDTDSNEVNNNFNTATQLLLGSTKKGTILASGDEDYYKVNQTTPGVLNVLLTPVPRLYSSPYLKMYCYNTDMYSSEIKNVINQQGETMGFSLGPLDAGQHYFRALSYNNSSWSTDQYSMTVSFDTSDMNEMNNNFALATSVSLGQQKRGTIKSGNDEDFFKVVAASNSALKLNILKIPTGLRYMRVIIYSDANFNSSLADNAYQEATSVNYTSTFNLISGRTYYIRFLSYYGGDESNEQYKLTLSQ